LLVVGRDGLSHHRVRDLPALLRPGDRLVLNDTRVSPVRLFGRRDAVAVEATLVERLAEDRWRALVRPGRRLRLGDRAVFGGSLVAEVAAKAADGSVSLRFTLTGDALDAAIAASGAMPLPPYIRRPVPDPRDVVDYQTVFAREPGAVAAPTAGLHFTPALFTALTAAGVGLTMLTLHVGPATFLPVKAARVEDHVVQAEDGRLTPTAAAEINATRAAGGRIVAVGTTVCRLLESAAAADGRVQPFAGPTGLFIRPGHRFRAIDLLWTNFHLPRSTLFMLVAAFAGVARMQAAYRAAIDAGYRFYSYGDASLIHPDPAAAAGDQ
jgi:S-adenosylmethionine:tRNA ribosyltransferase-isomerase